MLPEPLLPMLAKLCTDGNIESALFQASEAGTRHRTEVTPMIGERPDKVTSLQHRQHGNSTQKFDAFQTLTGFR